MSREAITRDLTDLMAIPGLAGHEGRVCRAIAARLDAISLAHRTDRPGNLITTIPGTRPSVMVFAHMDQLGLIVRRIEADGRLALHRVGGLPERVLPGQGVLAMVAEGRDVPGVIATKAHHATGQDEKYRALPADALFVDAGFNSADEARAAGIAIGTPVVYHPQVLRLANGRIAGTSVDDRAGCAVLLALARAFAAAPPGPETHLVFTVQEEFNLRGAQVAAQVLAPDIAIQLDIMLATDTPEMADRGEMRLGGGPGMSLYSFHGRGTLNGVIPHPGLVDLIEQTAEAEGTGLQRAATVGVLTDLSYVQLVGQGVAALDLGFPMRHSHAPSEMVDPADLEGLARLLAAALPRIGPDFPLERETP